MTNFKAFNQRAFRCHGNHTFLENLYCLTMVTAPVAALMLALAPVAHVDAANFNPNAQPAAIEIQVNR